MRIIMLFMGLLLISLPATAQTPVTMEMANAYFENCNRTPSPNMSTETQEYLCACTSAKMMETMSIEDVQTMSTPTEEGRLVLNKMMVDVYAPCMDHPAKELYYNNCINDPKTSTMSKSPESTCQCLSKEVASYLSSEGPQIFEEILKANPTIVDPMAALSEDPDFQSFAKSKLLACVL